MKKKIFFILTCAVAATLVVSVKIAQLHGAATPQVIHGSLLACDDPPPPPPGGE